MLTFPSYDRILHGPLQGLRIVITRAPHQLEEVAAPLRALGATVLPLPLLITAPPEDTRALEEAGAAVNQYDWIVFTSANAARSFHPYLLIPPEQIKARVAAIGPGTKAAAEALGVQVALMPEAYVAESLVDAFSDQELSGVRFLIPRANIARDTVPDALRRRGAIVETVDAYRTIWHPEAVTNAPMVFRDPLPDWLLFASASAVEHAVSLIPQDTLARVRIGSIGPITSAAVIRNRLRVSAEAQPHTIAGLVDAIVAVHCGIMQD